MELIEPVVLAVEIVAALIIVVGVVVAFWQVLTRHDPAQFSDIRLTLGRFLVLGLEFQLASDLLKTAVSPNWEQLGQLALVATIRTALNYFLTREIEQAGAHP
jgi:uncharacterized membrane protein